MVAAMVLIVVAVVTMLVDGGARLRATTQADTYAAEGARAAAIAIGPSPQGGQADVAAAVAGANTYLSRAGVSGTVTVTGPARVTVTVTVTASGPITGMTFSVTRAHTAQLQVGVETGGAP